MENTQDFEAPIDDATESGADPSAGYESPAQEPYEPPPEQTQWEIPFEPPVEPARDPYDDLPAWLDGVQTLGEYTKNILEEAGNRFRQKLAEDRVKSAETQARETHNGDDGLPIYDDLVNHYAVPLMQQQPALRQLVLRQHNPAEASYLIGFCARYPDLVQEVLRRNGRIDKTIFSSINFRPTVQGGNSGRLEPSGKVNYADWDNNDFLVELDRFKMEGE